MRHACKRNRNSKNVEPFKIVLCGDHEANAAKRRC
jgi:hypothetical protein